MKAIPLTQGKVTWVDDSDYEELAKHKWHFVKAGYAIRNDKEQRRSLYMHRQIMGFPNGMDVDHINGDRLLNIRQNLRVISHKRNMMNRSVQKNSLSGHKGIRWETDRKQWSVRIGLDRKTIHVGRYSNLDEAITARICAIRKYHGEYGRQTWDEPVSA